MCLHSCVLPANAKQELCPKRLARSFDDVEIKESKETILKLKPQVDYGSNFCLCRPCTNVFVPLSMTVR